MKANIILVFVLLLLSTCKNANLEINTINKSDLELHEFIESSYSGWVSFYPENSFLQGNTDIENIDKLNSLDPKKLKHIYDYTKDVLDLLHQYDYSILSREDQIIYKSYEYTLNQWIEYYPYFLNRFLLSPSQNNNIFTQTLYFFTSGFKLDSEFEIEKYIKLLKLVPKKINEIDDIIQHQIETDIIQSIYVIIPSIRILTDFVSDPIERNYLYIDAQRKINLSDINETKKEQYLEKIKEIIVDKIYPTVWKLQEKLEIQKKIKKYQIGFSSKTSEQETYLAIVKQYSGLNNIDLIDLYNIFNIAQEELLLTQTRIRQNFKAIGFDQNKTLRVLYDSLIESYGIVKGNDLLDFYNREIVELAKWSRDYFANIPGKNIRIINDERGGYYIPSSLDKSDGAKLYINFKPTARYSIPSLIAHETYPGHHLNFELTDLQSNPSFLKFEITNGYLEGWATYAEYLIDSSGYYRSSPEYELGYLQNYASIIVLYIIDYGINILNWTYNESISFFVENTGYNTDTAKQIIETIIYDPGYKTSYYLGFKSFRELEEYEQNRLGSTFSYKLFHNKIFNLGPIPLGVLIDVF